MENLLYHLRFSIRLFRKDKFFSILNILGLALGITVSIILMLIVKSDFSYDKHYSKHERIFRLGAHYVIPDVDEMIGVAARELGPILNQTYPEIEELVRVHAWERALVKDLRTNERNHSGFAYRAPINILLLGMILIGSLLFVLIVTAFQSLKTARTNPVNSLKYEAAISKKKRHHTRAFLIKKWVCCRNYRPFRIA